MQAKVIRQVCVCQDFLGDRFDAIKFMCQLTATGRERPDCSLQPAIRRTRQQSVLSGSQARSEKRVYQYVNQRRRLAAVGVSGVFPPNLPRVSVLTLWDAIAMKLGLREFHRSRAAKALLFVGFLAFRVLA